VTVTTLEEVREAAMALSADERELLAADLSCSLEKEPGYDEAWAEEIQRRIEDLDSGRAKTIPGERVIAALRDKVARARVQVPSRGS
jgi:putative addiction module component (TIGR02574 family)